MESRENRKQHYIPQCYLRNFSPNNKNIFIYDKIEKKSFRNKIENIAYIDYFYELPEKYIENLNEISFGKKYYEKEFFGNNIEKHYSRLLEKINVKAKLWISNYNTDKIITAQEKEIFSQLIAIQYLRMPNIRDKWVDARKKATNYRSDLIKSFLINKNPKQKSEIEDIKVKYNEEYNPILHSEIFSDEELYIGIANQLINKHWVYYVSEFNDFYTSDNPIIIKPHIKGQKLYYSGFGMNGAEIIFPIGSSILLTIWDSNFFIEKKTNSNSFCLITDKEKREYNCFQYMFSNKQTYSYNNNFSLIKLMKICNNGKEFFSKRPKILVNGK